MKNIIGKAWEWLVFSSQDPNKVALTVKGAILAAIPVSLWISGSLHFTEVSSNGVTTIAGDTGELVGNLLGIVGTAITAWGLIRKIKTTLQGQLRR